MAELHLIKLNFKPGMREKWLSWCIELKTRKDEVLETLRNENVLLEACFLSEADDCVYYFIEVEDMRKAQDAFQKSHFPIDREHEKIKREVFESETHLKNLFEIKDS
jgi:hypothetical protein